MNKINYNSLCILERFSMKKLFLIFVFLFSTSAYATELSIPTIEHILTDGTKVRQYGQKDDNEYATDRYTYKNATYGSKKYFIRDARLISRPCRDIQANGKVYEEPNCRILENGHKHGIIGWSMEDYGTIVEYDVRWILDVVRTHVYAINDKDQVTKYKIVRKKHKNRVINIFAKLYEDYEPVSYFVQTKVGVKPKSSGFKYNKNGKLVWDYGKQTEFSEIKEYDMDNNLITVYRKNEWDRIIEYEPDGKTLRTYHDTTYLPFLQWSEDSNREIYKPIDEFVPMLFDR